MTSKRFPKITFLLLLLTNFPAFCASIEPARQDPPVQSNPTAQADSEINSIFQFFAQSQTVNATKGSGAYLWIPPKTPKIRAVMVGIHNGLPVTILQNPAIRKVCRAHGIAQILLTPNGSEIGAMLKDLNFDFTDPVKTEIYDAYLKNLAAISEHPELITAPIVPLAHSAYMSFPFEAAMRNPESCLAAIPIKSGTPDVYVFFGPNGKAKVPNPSLNLRNVPILIVTSASQETVGWSAYPHNIGPTGYIESYRRDHDDNPGTVYEQRNELLGACWDMMSGHFDMLPRNYEFLAAWLDSIAQARLPEVPGAPLKTVTLRDGWLMNPSIPMDEASPQNFPTPARYLDFKGPRNKALWFPTEALAQTQSALLRDEPGREIELFTVCDPKGEPISLAHGSMAVIQNAADLLLQHGDGQFILKTHHFITPPDICTAKDKGHAERNDHPHTFKNVLFPNKASLPLSKIPLRFDPNGAPLELVKREESVDSRGITETSLTLKVKLHRLHPDGGYRQFYPRIYHEGSSEFAAAGRTVQISWVLQDFGKSSTSQTVTFEPIADQPAATEQIPLNGKSSVGLPVDYFVQKGPGIIQHGHFVPMEIPTGGTTPIEVTIGAYQVGSFHESGGVKASRTVYQSFHLTR